MGRQQLDRAAGQHPELDARAVQLVAGDPLLDDAAALCELGDVDVERRRLATPAPSPRAAASPRPARRASPGLGQPGQRRPRRCPHPDTPSLSLTMALAMDGRPCAHRRRARRRGRRGCAGPRRPAGAVRRPRRTAAGTRSSIPVRPAAGPRRTSGCRGSARRRARARWCCRAPGASAPGWGPGRAIRRSSRGRSSSFSLSERGDASLTDNERQAGPGVARDDPGQQRQVVLHDLRGDRHRGHVDHPQPRLAQQQQQEQEPLLVRLRQAAAARRRPGPG